MSTPVERVQGLLGTLRRRWRVTLGVVVLAVGTTLTLSMHSVRQYDATAQILLQPSDAISQTIMPGLIPSSADAQRDVDTNAALITAHPVVRAVKGKLHLRVSDPALVGKVTVSGQSNSNVVSITARDSDPELARRIATAFARQYGTYRLTIAQAAVSGALKAGRTRLHALQRSGITGPRVGVLRARVAELEASTAVQTGGVQMLRAARLPTSPATPQPLRSAIISLIVGMLVAVAAALVLQLVDSRLLTGSDVEAAFGTPVLAVPPVSRRFGRRRSNDHGDFYGELAARLGYVGNEGPGVLMVSSSGRGQSSANVVGRLTTQLAALDRSVIVVQADFRATTACADGHEGEIGGLCAVLQGRSSLAQELVEVHLVADVGALGRLTGDDAVCCQLLPAGGPAHSPGALLGRSAMGVVLSEARLRSDVVIVQAAAPERVSESLPVAALSDGILLLAELHCTTREDAAAARRALEGVYGQVLGVIAVPRARRRLTRGAHWSAGARGSVSTSPTERRSQVAARHLPGFIPLPLTAKPVDVEPVAVPRPTVGVWSRTAGPSSEEG
jgi:capsular polysaccharide biosynthesis protein